MAAPTVGKRENATQCSSLTSTVSTSFPASERSDPSLTSLYLTASFWLKNEYTLPTDFASQLQERLQGLDAGGDVNAVVHEILAATNDGDETPGNRPPAPKGRNSRPSSREIPKARNPLAPLPTDTYNRRPSSRQREGTTPGSFRKVPPVPEAPHGEENDKRRPLSREQRRRVNARRKRESMDNGSGEPFGTSPTWSSSRAQHHFAHQIHPSIHACYVNWATHRACSS